MIKGRGLFGLRLSAWSVAALVLTTLAVQADTLRVATFNSELMRDGPGLLLRDIARGQDPQVQAVMDVISATAPDVLALQGFDWDHENRALKAFANALNRQGAAYPHLYSRRPNSGLASQHDMDGDGRLGGPGDAQGFGTFTGQGGIAVLSRHPILRDQIEDFSALLWSDLPNALTPVTEQGAPYPSPSAHAAQRLSSTGHWVVPVRLPGGQVLRIMTFQAGPPVFDGPEDRNGKRNHDEILLWQAHLDGLVGTPPPSPYVIAGGANLDPWDSDGRHGAIRALLADRRLQDVEPRSDGADQARDQGHRGRNALDTVDWPSPGRMRVDYVLPSSDLKVVAAGVHWPAPGQAGHEAALLASRHRLVWVDLQFD